VEAEIYWMEEAKNERRVGCLKKRKKARRPMVSEAQT